jgi:dUTP pyrophosphatase
MFELKVKLLSPTAKCPVRDPESCGYDLYSSSSGTIYVGGMTRIALGIATAFTEGYVGLIEDRSSMGNKGITKFGGVIDWSYRGEWSVILHNSTVHPFEFKAGDKLAQVLFMPIGRANPVIMDNLPVSLRGSGGFGSTDLRKMLNDLGFPHYEPLVSRLSIPEQEQAARWLAQGHTDLVVNLFERTQK